MKVSEVFKQVAELLPINREARARSPYICDNITELTNNYSHAAHKIIKKRLGGMFSVYEWLIAKGHIQKPCEYFTSYHFDPDVYTKIQQYRKEWCLELAREFEAKGK